MKKFKNKPQVTVWGGSGFIGSHVCDELSKNNYRVIIADKKKSKWVNGSQKMFIGDVTDYENVEKSLKNSKYVFNFAGIVDIDVANRNLISTIKQNIIGNANVLKASKKLKLQKYIYASTIYVFSNSGGFYRASKQSAEIFIKEFNSRFNLNYNILRFGTIYGTRADHNNAVYRYIKYALENKKIIVPGSKDILREYINVSDVAELCVKILDRKYDNQSYIITGNNNYKLQNLFKMISEICKKKVKVVYKPNVKSAHYTLTPYAYVPEKSKKFVNHVYTDLGQGLLEIMNESKN